MTKTRYQLRFLADRFKVWNVSEFSHRTVQDFVDEHLESVSSGFVARDLAILKAILNKVRCEELTDFAPSFTKVKGSKLNSRGTIWHNHKKLAFSEYRLTHFKGVA